MMTLHKLSAGHGYTYLTRQVAANDATATGYPNLAEYLSERGEAPGVWLGRGLEGLDSGPGAGDGVRQEQMVALFGRGWHPNAERMRQEALATGASEQAAQRRSQLGTPFTARDGATAFRQEFAQRVIEHNLDHGRPAKARVGAEVRAGLRTELAGEWFVAVHGRAPADDREPTDYLRSVTRPGKSSVAGYDLTFSPVKSVSALWALADHEVSLAIEAAHDATVRDVVAWLEDTAVYTRLGRDGVRQVDVTGLLAVAFTHRDTRTGDPDLHTHVAISNKVQTLDGQCRALDGRVLHKAAVAASERYNTRLEAQLMARLDVMFADRPGNEGKRPVRELVGLEPHLLDRWSSRRRAIITRQSELAAEFTRVYGRQPDAGESHDLFDRANTSTRPHKHGPRSIAEQRAAWWAEAVAVLGDDDAVRDMLHGIAVRSQKRDDVLWQIARRLGVPSGESLMSRWIADAAGRAVQTVAQSRATWQTHHVRAEIERLARADHIPVDRVDAIVDAAVMYALSPDMSVRLGGDPDPIREPAVLRRRDGASVFTVAGAQLFTSQAVLDAEARILTAAGRVEGRRVPDGLVELSLLEARAQGRPLNAAQEQLVRELATSGRIVHLALAPAGSGKTTALGLLARAWAEDGGTVVGLAPSATAAAELRSALDAPTDTVAKLLHSLASDRQPGWVNAIGPDTLIVIDEAGMVGTRDLDGVVQFAVERGAGVRLVGDARQLSARASGGVLRDIARAYGAGTLDTLVRFGSPAEAAASLALRDGDSIGLGYYLDHSRVHAGSAAHVLEQAVAAWTADRALGRDAILLAATNAVVRDLNERVRAARLGVRAPSDEIALHDGTRAGAGDVIVTRRNDRRLPISSTDWVKNGDRWQVESVVDGSMQVTHLASRRHVELPVAYVERHVELGYATTIHLAQGRTADTCHTVHTGRETRELLYVAMTRSRDGNHLYLDTGTAGDPHDATTPDSVRPPSSVEILERILARHEDDPSATTARPRPVPTTADCRGEICRGRRHGGGRSACRPWTVAVVAAAPHGGR